MAETPDAPSHRRRWLRHCLLTTAAVLAGAVLFEFSLRFLLFVDAPLPAGAARLRNANLFANKWSDEHHALDHVFTAPEKRREARHHPLLGWTVARIEPQTFAHADAPSAAGRRPVLLFGDSFAACVTEPRDCWEGLLERSPLGASYRLLNYGVPGYGFDQTCLLMRACLERWQDANPVIVLSLLVDADLDRSALSFSFWPKPRLSPEGGLEVRGAVPIDADAWIAERGLGIQSYAWRWLVHGSGLLPEGWMHSLGGDAAHEAEVRRLVPPLLASVLAELQGRDLEFFVLVFHGTKHLREEGIQDWRETLLLGELERLGIPYVSSKRVLIADRRATGRTVADYFVLRGPSRRHYSAQGNAIVFAALRDGLEGKFDGGR